MTLAGTTANAAPGLLTPLDVGAQTDAGGGYDIAFAPDDTLVIAWATDTPAAVYVATRAPGASTLSPAITLTSGGGYVAHPQVVVDSHGSVTVAWLRSDNLTVTARTRAPGEVAFSTARQITSGQVQDFVLLTDPAGALTVLSHQVREFDEPGLVGASQAILAASLPAGAQSWSQDAVVAKVEGNAILGGLVAETNSSGKVWAAWTAGEPEGLDSVLGKAFLSSGTASSGFATPTSLNTSGSRARQPSLALTSTGATVVWSQVDISSDFELTEGIFTATQRAGQELTVPAPVAAGDFVRAPRVVVDHVGTATVAWESGTLDERGRPAQRELLVRTTTAAGLVSQQALFQASDSIKPTGLVVAPDGGVAVAWQRGDGLGPPIRSYVAHRRAGGSFASPVPLEQLSADDDELGVAEPRVAVDSTGDLALVWDRFGSNDAGSFSVSRTSVLDVSAPTLTAVSIPPKAPPGIETSMSASVHDRWSGATISWVFGDGTTATGGSVSHTYAAAGSYEVTLTATDAFGNASTSTRTVSVSTHKATAPDPSATSTPTANPTATGDVTPPSLTRVRLRPKVLRAPQRVTLTATVSEAATLRIVVQRKRGARWHRVSVARSTPAAAGRASHRLFGRSMAARLPAGRYRIRVGAIDAAGNRAGTVTLRWRVASS